MKQKTSIYLDDPDREAVQKIGEYYGITSDTDVFSFSVRAVARAIPQKQKEGQVMSIPTQSDVPSPRKQWQVDVYTAEDQQVPHTFYDETLTGLRDQVHSWLETAQPTYISSRLVYEKSSRGWGSPTDNEASVYRKFANHGLEIKRGPEYEDTGFVDGKFRLEYVRKTSKNRDTDEVNRLLDRGWHVLSLELDRDGPYEITYYVLGHVEPDAF